MRGQLASEMEGEEEVPETPPTLRSCLLVGEGGTAREHYEVGYLEADSEEGAALSELIPLSISEGKVVVAVPSPVWNRAVSRRYLPRMALSKAILVEVAAAEAEDLESITGTTVKVWLGLLDPALEGAVIMEAESEEPGIQMFVDENGEVRFPTSESLAVAVSEHFAFVTAQSGTAGVLPKAKRRARQDAGKQDVETRVLKLETTLEDIRGMLTGLAGGSLGGAERSAAATVPAGLDPGVASAARDAGITEEQLRKLGSLMMKPNRMVEAARGEGVPRRKTALSESEDEEEAAEDTAGEDAAGAKPIEKAVLQLTKLMATMAKPSRKKGGLEGILERIDAGGTGGDGGPASSSGGRSKAAAYLKLKEALRSHPSWIYQSIEGQMEEDFSAVRSQPGSTSVVTTSRAWVEHRSRIGHFPSTIRAAWLLAGVHDSLKNQEFDQARARCCLGLAAIDQSAMDQGNWSLAQEFLLELPPPYGSFSNRRPVDPSEHQSTRLVDDRFLEVMMWRLRDRDHFHESKKRLSANQTRIRPPPGGDGGQPRGEPKDPKKKPKPKPRPRQEGGQAAEEAA